MVVGQIAEMETDTGGTTDDSVKTDTGGTTGDAVMMEGGVTTGGGRKL